MDESITDNFLGITDAAAFYKENRMINDKNNLSMWAVIALLLEWKKRQAPAPTSCFRKRAVGGGCKKAELIMITKYKYIEFVQTDFESRWNCINRRNKGILGSVSYYSRWKEFVFAAEDICVIFNNSCLRDIALFLDQLNQQRAAAAIERAKAPAALERNQL